MDIEIFTALKAELDERLANETDFIAQMDIQDEIFQLEIQAGQRSAPPPICNGEICTSCSS